RGNQHLHAVCGPEGEYLRGAPEEDRAELALLVLEREVDVSRRRGAEVGNLARHPHSPHPTLERLAHECGELGDGQDARRGFGTGSSGPLPPLSPLASTVVCSITMSGTMPVAWIERPLGVK